MKEKAPTVQNRQEYQKQLKRELEQLEAARERVSERLSGAQGREWFSVNSELSNLNSSIYIKTTVLNNLRTGQPSHGHEIGGNDGGSGLVNTNATPGTNK